jgi:diguanylate cyclase (GGDEF)-like protein
MHSSERKTDSTPEILFSLVRDMIYDPNKASFDLDGLDPAYRDLGEGLRILSGMIGEQRRFAEALARGDLQAPIPSRDNDLAAPLKSLHASLRHITWQSQQVAAGDYKQKIDFMGEFSDSFNAMISQLDARQKALEYEIEVSRKKTMALENSSSLFMAITERIPQTILVISPSTFGVLFQNEAAKQALLRDPSFMNMLFGLLGQDSNGQSLQYTEACCTNKGITRYYAIHQYPIHWSGMEAVAFIAEDISKDKENLRKLEERANVDELTKLYTRPYGMEILNRWLREEKPFCVCFTDLDYLKYVNDTFGHNMGDAYIIAAAALLRGIAPGAAACRLGGDEFMVLVPSQSEEDAERLMENLQARLMLAPAEITTDEDVLARLKFNMSFGVVEAPTDGSASASELLAVADEKMYERKRKSKAIRRA